MIPLILAVPSETLAQQNERRSYTGQTSHQSYATTLQRLRLGIAAEMVSCLTSGDDPDLKRYDGIIFAGSPIQMHKGGAEARASARFMVLVFEAGVPAFWSCTGLRKGADKELL